MAIEAEPERRIAAVRRFNRFYTKQIGILHEGYLASPFSLAEVRVLYELAHHGTTTASGLSRELGLDAGYLSRILRGFKRRGLVGKRPSKTDGRQSLLSLTERGQKEFATLNARSHHDISAMLAPLSPSDQDRLVKAMQAIQALLGEAPERKVPYILRAHQPGDMGWVVQRHGVLYAEEYGWDERFEALVAGIVAKFIEQFDPRRERCWIAEMDGENVGSVFLVKQSESIAKLRLLLVEPKVRGLGIGTRLVHECTRFARRVGYRKITLWTNSVLAAARHIYEAAGFRLVGEEPHHSFGHDLIGETWELDLQAAC
jgi:DNA-binding MarR family transcriptional regulator/N-acetylglutamate synthase-like GNAT family acetyltransferase